MFKQPGEGSELAGDWPGHRVPFRLTTQAREPCHPLAARELSDMKDTVPSVQAPVLLLAGRTTH
jgi:hypothetical protein